MRGSWSMMGSVLRLQNWCKIGGIGCGENGAKIGGIAPVAGEICTSLMVHFAPHNWCNLHQLLVKFAPAILHQKLVHFAPVAGQICTSMAGAILPSTGAICTSI
ncbi:hypothetical protein Fot_15250 [Forsythia ovata]|uniref:Uncharacterized protein n=1 Tax=Forsythia ovata TaxID=205694 RepID=A0ABD1W8X5_9LAMI